MTVNAPAIGPGTLTIGSELMLTDFSSQARSCKIVPNVDKGEPIVVLSGETAPGDRTETFTMEATLQGDFGVESSTTEWLWEHRGEVHDFVYIPNATLGRKVTGQLVVEAIEIGGEVKTKPTADVTFDLVGEPVFGPVAGG
ncbi:hypothetical protein [Microterricola viridarii]|uniref:Uncharacterized protein n=1 Tax=Microterricola viridarii TaxID=412690 RepID=A0A0X8E0R8_9MICO|nr:hypothetical protein [Microterricola viridarii]AMB58240.1 hypothetical protein AWU67_04555 [Microterricola viridarii]